MPETTKPNTRQRTVTYIVLIASIVFLVALNLVSWRFLFTLRGLIDDQFGRQLMLTASNIELSLNRTQVKALLTDNDRISLLFIQQELETRKEQYELERIFIVDQEHTIAACSDPKLTGRPVTNFIFVQPGLLDKAWKDTSLASQLYDIEGVFFKSAFLPLKDQYETILGLVAVEANAAFLETIGNFQKGLIAGGVVSGIIIAFFFVFLFTTATRLMRLQESVAASERLALLGSMASRITHEIRNPLGIIKSTADLIRRRYDKEDQPDELFTYINDEVRRLNELIHNFLTFSREKDLELKPTDLKDLLSDLAKSIEPECAEKKITLETTLGALPGPVPVDPDATRQMVLNLVLNARDAIGEDGTITLQLSQESHEAVILVQDTGPGIAPEQVENIFDPFFSTKSSGSGLGLSITRKIAENHQGRITVETKPNQGATFSIYLPLK